MNCHGLQKSIRSIFASLRQNTRSKQETQTNLLWLLLLDCPANTYSRQQSESGDIEAHFSERAVLAEVETYTLCSLASKTLGKQSEDRCQQPKQALSQLRGKLEPETRQLISSGQMSEASPAPSFISKLSSPVVFQQSSAASDLALKKAECHRTEADVGKRLGREGSQQPPTKLQKFQHKLATGDVSWQGLATKDHSSRPTADSRALPSASNRGLVSSNSNAHSQTLDFQACVKFERSNSQQGSASPALQKELIPAHSFEQQTAEPLAAVLQSWQNPCVAFQRPIQKARYVSPVPRGHFNMRPAFILPTLPRYVFLALHRHPSRAAFQTSKIELHKQAAP